MPVRSEPTLALNTMTCKKGCMVSQIHDGAEEGRDGGHTLRSGRRWSENRKTRPIIAALVPVLRGAHSQC